MQGSYIPQTVSASLTFPTNTNTNTMTTTTSLKIYEIVYRYGPDPSQIFTQLEEATSLENARQQFNLGYQILLVGELGDYTHQLAVHSLYIEMLRKMSDSYSV